MDLHDDIPQAARSRFLRGVWAIAWSPSNRCSPPCTSSTTPALVETSGGELTGRLVQGLYEDLDPGR